MCSLCKFDLFTPNLAYKSRLKVDNNQLKEFSTIKFPLKLKESLSIRVHNFFLDVIALKVSFSGRRKK